MRLLVHTFTCALGVLRLASFEGRLAALDYEDYEARFQALLAKRFPEAPQRAAPPPSDIIAALDAYFAGAPDSFAGLELEERGTPFEERVWGALRKIGFGETVSYGTIAAALGAPRAARAVGHANGRNPIAIVTPCHRIIGASGALTGYAGGLWRKQWLLAHEGALLT